MLRTSCCLEHRSMSRSLRDGTEQALWHPANPKITSEPVIAADGHTYEKLVLQQWRLPHETSPVSGALMHCLMIPNLVVKNLLGQ
ncbi:TPA: hypothetical protein ACH3X1_004540 [Trebouxia sp. C0004]